MSRRYFYGRVSSKGQNLARQLESAKKYKDIDRMFTDKESGKNFDRAEYQKMKSIVQRGDEVIVHALNRLGRNKAGIKEELAWFKEHGVIVRILDVPTTLIEYPEGQEWVMEMVNNILIEVLGAFAEQERDEDKKSQAEGIAAMPRDEKGRRISTKPGKEGRTYGRKEKRPEDFAKYYELWQSGEISVSDACKALDIGRTTWYKLVKEAA